MLDTFIKTLELSKSIEFRAPDTTIKLNVGTIKTDTKEFYTDIRIRPKSGHWVHLFRYEEVESWVHIPNKKHTIVNIRDVDFGAAL